MIVINVICMWSTSEVINKGLKHMLIKACVKAYVSEIVWKLQVKQQNCRCVDGVFMFWWGGGS